MIQAGLYFLEALARMAVVRLRLSSHSLAEPVETEPRPERGAAMRAAAAVRRAARIIPRATCLAQALTLEQMLQARNIQAAIRIGVSKSPDFQAHAWVEHNGRVILGAPIHEFTPLLAPPSPAPRASAVGQAFVCAELQLRHPNP